MTAPSGRSVFLAMIPVHLLLLVWVWVGRAVFDNVGWMTIILMLYVIPFVALGLTATTMLSFSRRPAPQALTSRQVRAQLLTWTGLFIVGLFMYDFADTPDSERTILTQLFGSTDAMFTVSALLVGIGAVLAVGGWFWLLIQLRSDRSVQPPELMPTTAGEPDRAGG